MRLRRIDAVRYGRLENVSLSELGEGLTVVLGPNGSGKTTFTTLVRHVLYGYPTKRDAQKGYESAAGKRLARLEFGDDTGRWVIERTEGTHGGSVDVRTIEGDPHPGLRESIVRGVSDHEFRVVFGFGLDDMPEIEPGRSGIDVLARFYAAGAGLAVNPQDVKRSLDSDGAALYKPSGSKPVINATLSAIRSCKGRIRELEDAALRYGDARRRVADLKEQVEQARTRRDASALRGAELATCSSSVESIDSRLAEIDAALSEQRSELERLAVQAETLGVDMELLDNAAVLDALLEELSGYREKRAQAARLSALIREAKATADRILEGARIEPTAAGVIDPGPQTVTTVERFREQLTRAELRVESAKQALHAAEDRVTAARGTADAASDSAVTARSGIPGIAFVMLALGATGIAAGALLREWVSVGIGGLMALAGAVLLVLGSRWLRPGPEPLLVDPGAAHAVEVARAELERSSETLAELQSEWEGWATRNGLQDSGTPHAAVMVLSALAQWASARAEADGYARELSEVDGWCEQYRDRLSGAAGASNTRVSAASLDEVVDHATEIRHDLETARAMQGERQRLADRIAEIDRSAARLEIERAQLTSERGELLVRVGVPDADTIRLRALVDVAAKDTADADAVLYELTAEFSALEGELNTEGRDAELAELRLELAGLEERLAGAVDQYSVLAVAGQLIAETQAFHEKARQPDVLRRAGEILKSITHGLYDRVVMPAGAAEVLVFRGSEAVPVALLSRGTQEQLYLALRIALIDQLGDVGQGLPVLMDDILVNFDPVRREGAIEAVAELARHRQVVYFTCHSETAEFLERAGDDVTRLILERC